jgi:hypothetical protein
MASPFLSPIERARSAAPLLSLLALDRGLFLSFDQGSYFLIEKASPSVSHDFSSLADLKLFLFWLPLASPELLLG